MSKSVLFDNVFFQKKVLVTGHTGFKGAWLSLWLKQLGAEVFGYSLGTVSKLSFYEQCHLEKQISSHLGDVRDGERLKLLTKKLKPDIIFHLAAQSLVRRSYENPAETFSTNVMGCVNVLEAIRVVKSVRVCQIITSDKCYDLREFKNAYCETDRLGGSDPYSASKSCEEQVVSSYLKSFFIPDQIAKHDISLSSVRAGNVIGGGDWADDRLVPDCIRALSTNQPLRIRHPNHIRPWQYVLDALSGYLCLASKQWQEPDHFAGAWNFGPDSSQNVTVSNMVKKIDQQWGNDSDRSINLPILKDENGDVFYEAPTLRLDFSKARAMLHWHPTYSLNQTIEKTVAWYRQQIENPEWDAFAFSKKIIDEYVREARGRELNWAINQNVLHDPRKSTEENIAIG